MHNLWLALLGIAVAVGAYDITATVWEYFTNRGEDQ